MNRYDGIRMGRNYDGVIGRIWIVDMACAHRIFSIRKPVFLERVAKEKIEVMDVLVDRDAWRIILFLMQGATE